MGDADKLEWKYKIFSVWTFSHRILHFQCLLFFLILISFLQLNTLQLSLLTEGESWGCAWTRTGQQREGGENVSQGLFQAAVNHKLPLLGATLMMHGSCKSSIFTLLTAYLAQRNKTNKETRQHKWIWPWKLRLANASLFLTAWESLAVVFSLGFFFCLCLNASMQETKQFLRETRTLIEDHIPPIFPIWERHECHDYSEILQWLSWMWEGRD